MVAEMSDQPVCPKCGGHAVKDLSRIRRGLGLVFLVGALLALALLAQSEVPIPGWSLPVAIGVLILGVGMVVGARAARYCPRCNVRMEESQSAD
jgi:hypothetical protein